MDSTSPNCKLLWATYSATVLVSPSLRGPSRSFPETILFTAASGDTKPSDVTWTRVPETGAFVDEPKKTYEEALQ